MSTSKPEAKEKIKKLIERYEQVKGSRQTKTYNEANTRKDFIMPLFQALGWDIHNELIKREVVEEATAVKGRVDYSFRINNIPQFLLEAKALKINLEKPEWAEQAVNYGWNKGIPWVVLSNFEKLKLFNSDWKVDKPKPNLEFSYQDYIERFDHLWLLSKEASKTKELDKLLSQFGITAKRINVNEKLAEDLVNWRNNLTDNLSKWNTGYSTSEIEEAVQRILDRLIFVRVVEDREIEDKILWQAFQKWEANKYQPYNFIKALVPIFRGFDKKYNSNLFLPHPCEKLDTEGEPFQKIIPELYGNREAGVKYRFDAIGADVLGSVYEQYLGHVQQREGDKSKRKKQGIYYTPAYIVDYIVQQTLGEALKEKSLMETENIKVLDPACGSGSFLIKAFDVLDRKKAELRVQRNSGPKAALRKYGILRNNIYGVDLDSQAIEIARLNLLLRALEPDSKLPLLDNIKVGNSLISGEEKQLKKYFGKDYRDKKPFNWDKEFKEVFDQSGFDVIIGNPPWVESRKFSVGDKDFYSKLYSTATRQYDFFNLFIERSVALLKEGGILGFIVPDRFITNLDYTPIRKFLLEHFSVREIIVVGEGVFEGVQMPSAILILQKNSNAEERSSTEILVGQGLLGGRNKLSQKEVLGAENYIFSVFGDASLLSKLRVETAPLKSLVTNARGVEIGKKSELVSSEECEGCVRFLVGEDIDRYRVKNKHYLKLGYPNTDYKDPTLYKGEKLLIRKTGSGIRAVLDRDSYVIQVIYIFKLRVRGNYDLRYILALLNSTLMNFYYWSTFGEKDRKVFPHLTQGKVLQLPVRKIDFSKADEKNQHDELSELADKMLRLNQSLQKCTEDSDKYRATQTEIEKVDKQIDQMVYKLYELTQEEIEIVEKNNE